MSKSRTEQADDRVQGWPNDDDRSLPTYGQIPWRQLGRDVIESQTARREDFDFGDGYPGHKIVPGINFNSLARIVDKYRYYGQPAALAERATPSVYIMPMELADGRTDYFVAIKVGEKVVTPHVFREEYKAAYHVALYDWLLNGAGEEPDCVEFGPNEWPAQRHSPAATCGQCALFEAQDGTCRSNPPVRLPRRFDAGATAGNRVRDEALLWGWPAVDKSHWCGNWKDRSCKAPRAGTQDEDWREDPSADERWQAGCDFAMLHLCKALDVDPQSVRWDAATETLDGDVIAVIWNILRARMGDDWDPDASLSTSSDGSPRASGMQMEATGGAITRRPAHPKDTISGGPLGPSEPLAEIVAALEEAKTYFDDSDVESDYAKRVAAKIDAALGKAATRA